MATSIFRLDWTAQTVLGQAIPGALIYVCSQPASTTSVPPSPLASLFTDSTGTTPLANPLVCDGVGQTFGYAVAGLYTVVVVQNGTIIGVYADQNLSE